MVPTHAAVWGTEQELWAQITCGSNSLCRLLQQGIFYIYAYVYVCVYIYICIYVCTKLLTFSLFSPEGALSLSPKAVCYLWKIVQNKASQYLCSQDVQKWKRMMENCLPIGLRLDEEFSQVEPLDYFCTWSTSWILKCIEITRGSC